MDAIKHFHPVVGFSFFILMVILSLVSMQPIFQILSFFAAVSYAIAVSGIRLFLRGNWWLIILVIIVVLFNSVFGGQGLTVLFTLSIGFLHTPITLESLVYGMCMGLMLANVILWFNILGKLSSMQGFIEMFARFSPAVGMMMARITVFVPELIAQAKLVGRAQNTFAHTPTTDTDQKKTRKKNQFAYASALSSHLMEWGMEKSLITANSMVARGYGSRRRTSYRRTKLTLRDIVPFVIILVLGLVSLVCLIWAGMEYQYYPYLSTISLWWGYIPFIALCLMPLAMQLGEEVAWWRSR